MLIFEYLRELCFDWILDDIGGVFSMGVVGGFVWYFVKGMKNLLKGEWVLGGM